MTTLNEKQIKFFEDLQASMQKGAVQPDELTRAVKLLLEVIKNLKTQLEQNIQNSDIKLRLDLNTVLDEIKKLETKTNNAIGDASTKAKQLTLSEVSKIASKLQNDMEILKGDMPDLSDIEERVSEIEDEVNEIEVPEIEEIEQDLPKLGESIRDGLELIQNEDDKLSINSIGYLRKELDELKELIKSKTTSSGSGGGRITTIANLIIPISGTIDDSNVIFTSYKEPNYLIINGGAYQKTGGAITWTWVSGTITLSNAVGTNGSIWGIK